MAGSGRSEREVIMGLDDSGTRRPLKVKSDGTVVVSDCPKLVIGSYETDDITEIKQLASGVSTVDYYDTFREADSHYAPPSGKTFYITRLTWTCLYQAGRIEIGYGDDAVSDSASAPTNAKSLTRNVGLTSPFVSGNAMTTYQLAVFFKIPAGKYPYIRVRGSAQAHVIADGAEL